MDIKSVTILFKDDSLNTNPQMLIKDMKLHLDVDTLTSPTSEKIDVKFDDFIKYETMYYSDDDTYEIHAVSKTPDEFDIKLGYDDEYTIKKVYKDLNYSMNFKIIKSKSNGCELNINIIIDLPYNMVDKYYNNLFDKHEYNLVSIRYSDYIIINKRYKMVQNNILFDEENLEVNISSYANNMMGIVKNTIDKLLK